MFSKGVSMMLRGSPAEAQWVFESIFHVDTD